jgi:hypothetical protein
MSDKKIIQVNPLLFQFSTTRKTRKNKAPADPSKPIRIKSERIANRSIKRNKNVLLKYIRDQQEKNYKRFSEQSTLTDILHPPTNTATTAATLHEFNDSDNMNRDFEDSLQYLLSVAEKNKSAIPTTTRHNSTLRQLPATTESLLLRPSLGKSILDDAVNTALPNVFSEITPSPDASPVHIRSAPPQYGCLKNGQLPTYRMWKNRTVKNPPSLNTPLIGNTQPILLPPSIPTREQPPLANFSISSSPNTMGVYDTKAPSNSPTIQVLGGGASTSPNIAVREEQTSDIRAHQTFRQHKSQFKKRARQPKQKRILRRTYRVGKSKHYPHVSVLISNKTLRNQITTKAQLLKQTPMDEVKKTLIKKGLIKVGTTAPNDVLRKMYESVVLLCGDIHNHNSENLLYNYFNSDKNM